MEMESLPEDVVGRIVSYLDPAKDKKSLLALRETCRYMYAAVSTSAKMGVDKFDTCTVCVEMEQFTDPMPVRLQQLRLDGDSEEAKQHSRKHLMMPIRVNVYKMTGPGKPRLNYDVPFHWVATPTVGETGEKAFLSIGRHHNTKSWRLLIDPDKEYVARSDILVIAPDCTIVKGVITEVKKSSQLVDAPVGAGCDPNVEKPVVQWASLNHKWYLEKKDKMLKTPVRLLLPKNEVKFLKLFDPKSPLEEGSAHFTSVPFEWYFSRDLPPLSSLTFYTVEISEETKEVIRILRPGGNEYLVADASWKEQNFFQADFVPKTASFYMF